jgi:fructosamine-3-kinase
LSTAFLEEALRSALGRPDLRLERAEPVGGGCIHSTAHLVTTHGDFFAKWNEAGAEGVFLREAEGLRALRAAASGLVVPEVVSARGPAAGAPAFIVMEYLPHSGAPRDDLALGRGLAALHRNASPTFGFPAPTYCGSTVQDNRETASWAEFYAERRIRPLVRRLRDAGAWSPAETLVMERLCERLPGLVAREAPPSLIHGDLWSGNVLASTKGPALVDPACAYADREMEFGITTLFGGFSSRFFAAYEEAFALPAGWRERNPLYQAYHLLNHHLIFGGHYGALALAAARRYV